MQMVSMMMFFAGAFALAAAGVSEIAAISSAASASSSFLAALIKGVDAIIQIAAMVTRTPAAMKNITW